MQLDVNLPAALDALSEEDSTAGADTRPHVTGVAMRRSLGSISAHDGGMMRVVGVPWARGKAQSSRSAARSAMA